ncbi:MAG: EamA family transporter [Bacilli bacterium]|nr:EamA family transporter [Bacilli bacterium]
MWILYAFSSAFFAGITSILAKIGIKNTDSNVVTAVRTIVVLLFSFVMVAIVGSFDTISEISFRTLIFLILSGLATGFSWLFYFRALQIGDVNKVTPIDKSSTVLTMILAIIFLNESLTLFKGLAILLIGIGTYMMIARKESNKEVIDNKWLLYASLAALFASLTAILGKIGIEGIEANLGTSIRTFVVLIMAWLVVFVTKKEKEVRKIDKKSLSFIVFSGFTTGFSWLFYFRALQEGPASIVVPIDKLSIVVTILFSYFILKEKLTKKALFGFILILLGTMLLLI